MSVKTYDPKKVIAVFNGIEITGYADDSQITASRDEDAFTKKVGAGGEVARTRNNNKSGNVTFSLMQTSPCNDLLSAMAAADEAGGSGVGALSIKDLGGTTLINAENAWIKKVPENAFGKELGNREWAMDCEVIDIFTGGAVG